MAQIQEIDREMIRVQNKFGIPSREGDQRAPVTVSGAPGRPLRRRKQTRRVKKRKSSGPCAQLAKKDPPSASFRKS